MFTQDRLGPVMNKCLGCGCLNMTWREQQQQYGRLIQEGLSPEAAKGLMPRCQKCTTVALRGRLSKKEEVVLIRPWRGQR
jgi:hypothetical protein